MREQEYKAVTKLEPFERYQYFIKRVADFEQIWTLQHENGEYAKSEVDSILLFSFWPAKEFAAASILGNWENCTVKSIPLDEFIEETIPLILAKTALLNIFSVENRSGFIVSTEELIRDIEVEMEKYE